MTQRAGHAFDVMVGITNDELRLYDGVIAVVSMRLFISFYIYCIAFIPDSLMIIQR